jgi:hypothetical protein
MDTAQLVRVAVVALLGSGAMLGFALAAPAATPLPPPSQTDCGDMAGPVWHVIVPGEEKGSTGAHYTVSAINMSCAKARTLVVRMIRHPAPPKGFNRAILSGYTCLNTNAPSGSLFFIGGCIVGAATMPMPGATGFNWHHCQFVLGRGAHPTCKWSYYYKPS